MYRNFLYNLSDRESRLAGCNEPFEGVVPCVVPCEGIAAEDVVPSFLFPFSAFFCLRKGINFQRRDESPVMGRVTI